MILRTSLLAALIAAGLFAFVAAGFSDGHSAKFNDSWMIHYIDAFGWDTLLPRHLPGLWAGLGGYDFFFYGPLPFWFIAAFISPICSGCLPATEFVLGAAVFWLLGGGTFYLFARRYFAPRYAIFGALVYAALPYHLWVDWFIRQAVGEFAAYAFLPLLAFGLDAIRLRQRHGWTLSIGVAGITLCHLPTALLGVHVFGAIALLITWQKWRNKDNAIGFFMAIMGWSALGGLLCAFYWLPAVALLDLVSTDVLYTGHYTAERWLFGLHFDQPDRSFAQIILFSFLAVLPFIVVSSVPFLPPQNALRMWIFVPVILSLLLNLELSAFVWRAWIIQKVQFPWRLMVFVDFSGAIAVAFAVMITATRFVPINKARVLIVLVLLSAVPTAKVVSSGIGWAATEYNAPVNWAGAGEYLSPEMLAVIRDRRAVGNDYALTQREIALEIQKISQEIPATNLAAMAFKSATRHATLTPLRDASRVSVPLQYWSLWRAELDANTPLKLSANPMLGTIDIHAPDGGFQGRTVTLTLPYQPSEKLGFAASILSLLLLVAFVFNARRPKNQSQNQNPSPSLPDPPRAARPPETARTPPD